MTFLISVSSSCKHFPCRTSTSSSNETQWKISQGITRVEAKVPKNSSTLFKVSFFFFSSLPYVLGNLLAIPRKTAFMSYVDIFRQTKGSASMNLTEFLDATMSDVTCGAASCGHQ